MTQQDAVSELSSSTLTLIGHRGASGNYPENTLVAFEKAFQSGAKIVEFDVRLTKDGVLVVIHDESLERTTNGTGKVSDYSLTELQRLDAGYWFKDERGNYPFRGRGLKILALEEVLQYFPEGLFFIEPKDSDERVGTALLKALEKTNCFERVIIQLIGLSSSYGKKLRNLDSRLSTGHTTRECILFIALSKCNLARFFNPKGVSFELPLQKYGFRLCTQRIVKSAHKAGVTIVAWTVNDSESMETLSAIGVDAIMSDYPDRHES